MLIAIYFNRKMVNVTARLPFNLHGRSTSSKSYSHSYSRQDSRSMSPSSASASASAERSSRPPNAPVHSPSPLSVTTTPQKPPHSRARIHGHVGAPLGMSPISSPVVPTQAPTGMYANGNGNGNGHEHDQCRSPSRDPSSESTSASHSKSGSGSGSRKDDYEPSAGGRGGQMFGVRLVRGLPRSRASTAGPGTGPGRDLGTTTLATGEEGETGVEGAVANGRGRPLRKASESDEVEDTAAGAASPSPAAADKAGSTAAPPSTQTSMPMIITIPAPLATAVPIPVPEFKLKDTGPLVISWD